MTVVLRTLRLTTARSLAVPSRRFFHSAAPLAMNSTTATYQTSFGAEGNLGIAPKQMPQLQNLKLNDENEIPMVGPLLDSD